MSQSRFFVATISFQSCLRVFQIVLQGSLMHVDEKGPF